MIQVETSVVLAQLLAEDRCPPESLWIDTIVSSRLTEYEVWNRIHARSLGKSHGESVRLLSRLWLDLSKRLSHYKIVIRVNFVSTSRASYLDNIRQ